MTVCHNQPQENDLIAPSWNRASLITIDVQNDFSLPEGTGFVPETDKILPKLESLVSTFRRTKQPIYHAVRLYLRDGSNAERCRRQMLKQGTTVVSPGTFGARPVTFIWPAPEDDCSEILLRGEYKAVGPNEWVFYKPRWSAFYETRLDQRLKDAGVDTIVVAGCNFPNCPSATLFDATERDFRVVLAVDAVSRVDPPGIQWSKNIGVVPLAVAEIQVNLRRLE